jgi:cysteine desulfurase
MQDTQSERPKKARAKTEHKPLYADYNGSAPISNEVKNFLFNRIENGPFSNPNAAHAEGEKTIVKMENARLTCAKILGAKINQTIFNSGASEGIASAFHSVLHPYIFKKEEMTKRTLVISGIEHSAVRNNAEYYSKMLGLNIITIKTNTNGVVDFLDFEKVIKENADDIILVSIMAANNETGVIQPFQEIGKVCETHSIPYLCDTTQYIGKTNFNFKESHIDFAVTSGHKFGAPTGCGIILVKDPKSFKPFIIGGGQEAGLRGGTQNYISNECMAVALTSLGEHFQNQGEFAKKREEFEQKIQRAFPKVVIIGSEAPRMCNTTYISYPGIPGYQVQMKLEAKDIYVTTSSACSDSNKSISKVLSAMNTDQGTAKGVVRIGLGPSTDLSTYDYLYEALFSIYTELSARLQTH